MNNGWVRTAVSFGHRNISEYLCRPANGEFDVFTIAKVLSPVYDSPEFHLIDNILFGLV